MRVDSRMSRPIRIERAEAVYHIMARGNQGQEIYADDESGGEPGSELCGIQRRKGSDHNEIETKECRRQLNVQIVTSQHDNRTDPGQAMLFDLGDSLERLGRDLCRAASSLMARCPAS
jgi:hypothetical protein